MELRVPEVGESITEALVAKWHRQNGDQVRKEEPVCELETDKVTLEINAGADGILSILVPEGETVAIGSVIASIRESELPEEDRPSPPLSPAARKLARETSVSPETIKGTGRNGRILKEDMVASPAPVTSSMKTDQEPTAPAEAALPPLHPAHSALTPESPASKAREERSITRKPMSPIRRRIAERLTEARLQTAMVTTFNEVDMGRVIALRRQFKDFFLQRHGVSLGFMPFFVTA